MLAVARFATSIRGQSFEMLLMRALFIPVVWIAIGVVVAAIYDYFDSLNTVGKVLTCLAAVILWPLLLFGFDITIVRDGNANG
jgi:hypothetical protein